MTLEELDEYLSKHVPPEKRKGLSSAHWRYMNLIGIVDDCVVPEQVAADQKVYAHMIRARDGHPFFDDCDCVEFMAKVSGLPTEWCQAWMQRDFLQPLEA